MVGPLHAEDLLPEQQPQTSFIPLQSRGLAALHPVLEHPVQTSVSGLQPGPPLPLDQDAHLAVSPKPAALLRDHGAQGYQALLVAGAEQRIVLADPFRDGTVAPSVGFQDLVDRAAQRLPPRTGGGLIAVRSDSAAYAQGVLDHGADQRWRFAVPADRTEALRQEVLALAPRLSWLGLGSCVAAPQAPGCRQRQPTQGWSMPRPPEAGKRAAGEAEGVRNRDRAVGHARLRARRR